MRDRRMWCVGGGISSKAQRSFRKERVAIRWKIYRNTLQSRHARPSYFFLDNSQLRHVIHERTALAEIYRGVVWASLVQFTAIGNS